uniref:Uncharacterized protein LOC117349270 isoform X2 n=1 Tax=Geotrypetes seraphini TaxID=260995 RepID=A0A6P8PUG1_GEOSA|nr:uncharacterized protein LOC117349270 isoform X2 [Geotrypetes seraphini]
MSRNLKTLSGHIRHVPSLSGNLNRLASKVHFLLDNPLSCSPEEEEAIPSRDEAGGQYFMINQMEGPSDGSQDSPQLSRTDEWISMELDDRGQAESADRINNNQDPIERVDFQDEGLLLIPGGDLMTEVVHLLDFEQIGAPFRVNYGESATFEKNVGRESTSETEEFQASGDQTENENQEPLDDARNAIQEPEDRDTEVMTSYAGFGADDKGLCSQSEESDVDSDGGRDTLGPDVKKLLEMQKMNRGTELNKSSGNDQEGHEKEILNASNGNDIDKISTILDKPELLNNLVEQIKEPIMYEVEDHIQMKHCGLSPKEQEAYMEDDETLGEEIQEVCSTGSSKLASEETAMCHESAVVKITPEQELAKILYSKICLNQYKDEEQEESSEMEDDLNMEADKQLWNTDLVQQELRFHSVSRSYQLEEDSSEEDYNNEINKEESRDRYFQTDSTTKCSDDQDSKEDSDEERRRHDITDKLDPEVLHLLEIHLLKQQHIVIREEQEEEPGYDDIHINEQKEHFEAFVGSRKFTPPLDMVLEEPEPAEENEQTEGHGLETHPENTALKCVTAAGKSRSLGNGFGDQEVDLQDQLSDPLDKARASEHRASELQEVRHFMNLRQENTEPTLLSEHKTCRPERRVYWTGEPQTEVPSEAQGVLESLVLRKKEEEGQNTGNKVVMVPTEVQGVPESVVLWEKEEEVQKTGNKAAEVPTEAQADPELVVLREKKVEGKNTRNKAADVPTEAQGGPESVVLREKEGELQNAGNKAADVPTEAQGGPESVVLREKEGELQNAGNKAAEVPTEAQADPELVVLREKKVEGQNTRNKAADVPTEAQGGPESVVLREKEGELQNAGNKAAEQLEILRRELDFMRQESHCLVEQLNSLQQQLRTIQQVIRKPSSIVHGLVRTSLVAALGILLFWWGTDQLG